MSSHCSGPCQQGRVRCPTPLACGVYHDKDGDWHPLSPVEVRIIAGLIALALAAFASFLFIVFGG